MLQIDALADQGWGVSFCFVSKNVIGEIGVSRLHQLKILHQNPASTLPLPGCCRQADTSDVLFSIMATEGIQLRTDRLLDQIDQQADQNPDTVDKGFVVRGCAIFTVVGGKLVERWVNVDSWGRALQVGAIPS